MLDFEYCENSAHSDNFLYEFITVNWISLYFSFKRPLEEITKMKVVWMSWNFVHFHKNFKTKYLTEFPTSILWGTQKPARMIKPGVTIIWFYGGKYISYCFKLHTLASGIDIGQGINIGPGKFGKKNKRRALNTHVLCSK